MPVVSDFSDRLLDWRNLLEGQTNLLRSALPDNIRISLRVDPPGPYIIHADAARLQQMILNLAINARDAMPQGGVLQLWLDRLTLSQAQDNLPAGNWLRLRVIDNGEGISNGVQPYVFEPFFTTKEPGKGSGLGLSQAQGIVLQHDGRIEFATVVRNGTTFTIYLPAHGEAESAVTPSEPAASGRRETILLAEDNDTMRAALLSGLEALNYQVAGAANGREALNYLEAHPGQVAAILSDMVMPVMGGASCSSICGGKV